jgi:hypothetical protein
LADFERTLAAVAADARGAGIVAPQASSGAPAGRQDTGCLWPRLSSKTEKTTKGQVVANHDPGPRGQAWQFAGVGLHLRHGHQLRFAGAKDGRHGRRRRQRRAFGSDREELRPLLPTETLRRHRPAPPPLSVKTGSTLATSNGEGK